MQSSYSTTPIEESAFLLDLLCTHREPLVVTGAMRRPDAPGADGAANLASAIAVAGDPRFRDAGAVVVMADEIHAARYVRKTHDVDRHLRLAQAPVRSEPWWRADPASCSRPPAPTVPSPLRINRAVRVALVTLSMGNQGELLDAVDDRFDGLVGVAAFGAGHVPGS